jgi:outer membrane lipoprotein-sorting protein
MAKRPILTIACAAFFGAFAPRAAEVGPVLDQWLARQTNISSWEASFTQTRSLKALTQPLMSTGMVWFAAPQNFRWELGSNQTIALRKEDLMLVLYPRLKRAEKYDFSTAQNNQWKDSLALLQTGFPRSRAEIDQQFKILELNETNSFHQLVLEPKSAQARKMMPQIKIYIDPVDHTLKGTELVFADGSTMKNIFTNVRTNLRISPEIFSTEIPSEFKVIEPLKGK